MVPKNMERHTVLPRLTLLVALVPLIELGLLIYLGTLMGVLYTLVLVAATGVFGFIVARYGGLATLSRVRASLAEGIVPSSELFDGVVILAGGLLLLTPGVLTDAVGVAVLIPQVRRVVARWLQRWVDHRIRRGQVGYWEIL